MAPLSDRCGTPRSVRWLEVDFCCADSVHGGGITY